MLLINRRRVLGFGLLVFLAWATYAGSLGNDFVWDDTGYILDTPELRHPENVRLIIDPELYFSRFQEGSWRPLVTLSHFFAVGLFRYWAPGHNALDLFLYTLVVLLVFGLALQMGMRGRAALIAAALFAVHPVHVESVMVSGLRSDVLCALFLLSAFLCIIKADQGGRAGAWWAGAIGLYALGLLSKEVALVFPFLVLAYDGAIARQRKAPLEPMKVFGRRYGALLAVTGVYAVLRFGPYAGPPHSTGYVGGSLASAIITMSGILAQYARLLLFPLRLNADYLVRPIENLAEPQALAGLVVFVIAVYAIVLGYRKRPLVGFGLAWLLITLLPVANLVPLDNPMAERYLFIPSIGFCWAVGLLASDGLEGAAARGGSPQGTIVWGAIGLLIFTLGLRTAMRTRVWKDGLTLWRATVAASPESSRAHLNLGAALISEGRWEEAREEIEKALDLEPDSAEALHNLGLIEAGDTHWIDAEAAYRRSLLLQPDAPPTLYNLARALLAQGKASDEAEWLLAQAVSIKPLFTDAHLLMGNMLMDKGKTEEATKAYRGATVADPERAGAFSSLGNAERALGNFKASEAAYQRAIELQPASAKYHFNLASLYGQQRRFRETIEELERTVGIDPSMAVAHKNLGLLYWKTMRDAVRARRHLKRVLDLAPNHPEAPAIRRLLGNLPDS